MRRNPDGVFFAGTNGTMVDTARGLGGVGSGLLEGLKRRCMLLSPDLLHDPAHMPSFSCDTPNLTAQTGDRSSKSWAGRVPSPIARSNLRDSKADFFFPFFFSGSLTKVELGKHICGLPFAAGTRAPFKRGSSV